MVILFLGVFFHILLSLTVFYLAIAPSPNVTNIYIRSLSAVDDSSSRFSSNRYLSTLKVIFSVLALNELRKYVPANYEVRGHASEEIDMYILHGKPFHYKNVSVENYQQVYFGTPYSILLKPRLNFTHHVRVLTVVLSAACDFSARQLVRAKTQSYYTRFNVYTIFSLGNNPVCTSQVSQENVVYGDIIQFDHIDSYKNITFSVLHTLQWLQFTELPVDYVLKTDSDCVVNYPYLLQLISPYNVEKDNVYMGDCHKDERFNTRKVHSKNYIPATVVGKTVLPYYVSGGGYLISYHLLPRLMIAMRHVDYLTHHEDVNVGKGMQLLFVRCVDYSDFWVARNGCESKEECLKHVILHPKRSSSEVNRFYSYLQLRIC